MLVHWYAWRWTLDLLNWMKKSNSPPSSVEFVSGTFSHHRTSLSLVGSDHKRWSFGVENPWLQSTPTQIQVWNTHSMNFCHSRWCHQQKATILKYNLVVHLKISFINYILVFKKRGLIYLIDMPDFQWSTSTVFGLLMVGCPGSSSSAVLSKFGCF